MLSTPYLPPYLLQDAAYIAETIGSAIEAVGADNVDLVVTDSGGGNKQAGDILMARYATVLTGALLLGLAMHKCESAGPANFQS